MQRCTRPICAFYMFNYMALRFVKRRLIVWAWFLMEILLTVMIFSTPRGNAALQDGLTTLQNVISLAWQKIH